MNVIAFNAEVRTALPRVLVVADDPLTRAGLGALLGAQAELLTVGQTVSREVGAQLAVYDPAVLLWDVGGEPAAAFERLAALDDLPELANPPPPVVTLVTDDSHAAGAWLAGARGVFRRTAKIDHLTAGLIAVAHGIIALDPALTNRLIAPRETVDATLIEMPSVPLTAREREVLQWLAKGLANKTIAQQLTISESTVKFHVNAILGKLGAQSRTDAVVRATRLGLVIV